MQQSKNVEKQVKTRFTEVNELTRQAERRKAHKLQLEREHQEARWAKQQLFAC